MPHCGRERNSAEQGCAPFAASEQAAATFGLDAEYGRSHTAEAGHVVEDTAHAVARVAAARELGAVVRWLCNGAIGTGLEQDAVWIALSQWLTGACSLEVTPQVESTGR